MVMVNRVNLVDLPIPVSIESIYIEYIIHDELKMKQYKNEWGNRN